MKDQKFLGSLVGAILALGTVVWGSHELFFSRWEGEDLRIELREGLKGIRQEMTELTKAILSGKRTASAKTSLQTTKISQRKPEAEIGSASYFQSKNDLIRNQILKQSGRDFWLRSMDEDFMLNAKTKEGKK